VEDATDLTYLPLAGLRGGLFPGEWEPLTEEQRAPASLCLKGAQLSYVHLEGACLYAAHLERAHLVEAHLEKADLGYAHLAGADLKWGYLAEADLEGAHLEETRLSGASLTSVDLTHTTLANATGVGPSLVDIKWGDINLAVVDWGHVKRLGDEYVATQKRYLQDDSCPEWDDRTGRAILHQVGDLKDKDTQLKDYKAAVRANRQLAVVLRDQGINEEADYFAYRAQLLQRMVFWREHEFGRWLFSLLLALLSGYGYRIWRILAAYAVVISLFALVYFIFGRYYPPHLPLHQGFLARTPLRKQRKIGFLGVGLLVGPAAFTPTGSNLFLFGSLLVFIGSASYAFGSLFALRMLSGLPLMQPAIGQTAMGAVITEEGNRNSIP